MLLVLIILSSNIIPVITFDEVDLEVIHKHDENFTSEITIESFEVKLNLIMLCHGLQIIWT